MKHIVKKNQIIITALAIMIAVAGYLNYSGNALKKEAESGSTVRVAESGASVYGGYGPGG